MVTNVKKFWETGYVKCASTTIPQLITTLKGGESVTLKSQYNYLPQNHREC